MVARGVHVLVQWRYFSDRLEEAIRPQAGGLDWHGAVIGALVGMAVMAQIRRVHMRDLLPMLAWGVPLIGVGAWAGCAVSGCAFGREIPTLAAYPVWLVWDNVDIFGLYAPRFAVQPLGMALLTLVALFFVILDWRGIWQQGRFWWALMLLSVVMFGLGFLRGDDVPILFGIRADQWLDGVMIVGCVVTFFLLRKQWRSI
jgi:prolipoprotein diacylglyceryltransferase